MKARYLVPVLVALALVTTAALTATNAVPATRAGEDSASIGVNDLRPPECAGLTLAGIITGAGTITAPNGTAWLILGSAGNDTITGGNKTDCIVGGGGDDSINGKGGNDVCVGGGGNDTFKGCETVYQ